MTTGEKLDLRQKAYILANTVHGDTSKAEETYQFLERAFGEKAKCEAAPSDVKEIDWSRRQLVRSVEDDCIVRTYGWHTTETFSGKVVEKGKRKGFYKIGHSSKSWAKGCFVYHGEILTQKEKCLNMFLDSYCKLGTCTCEQPAEKTTGLNFLEAMKLCNAGNAVKREFWIEPDNVLVKSYHNELVFRNSSTKVLWYLSDFLATDWQIVKP